MMRTKEEITQTIKEQFVNVRERGRVLAQALKARADIAATRRRLRSTFADLGEAIYARLDAGESVDLEGMGDYKLRIEGLKAELRQREESLKEIMEGIASDGREVRGVDLAFIMNVLQRADGAEHIDLTAAEGHFEIAQIGPSLFDLGSGWPLRFGGNIADVDHKDLVAEVADDPGQVVAGHLRLALAEGQAMGRRVGFGHEVAEGLLIPDQAIGHVEGVGGDLHASVRGDLSQLAVDSDQPVPGGLALVGVLRGGIGAEIEVHVGHAGGAQKTGARSTGSRLYCDFGTAYGQKWCSHGDSNSGYRVENPGS